MTSPIFVGISRGMTFKEARKRAKLTRQQAYEIIGYSDKYSKKWELGISEALGWAENLVVEKLMRIKEELEKQREQ